MPSMLHQLERRTSQAYTEAIRRESKIRLSAFSRVRFCVCGEVLPPLTPRRMLILEALRNGFVEPCEFDDAAEMLAHAVELIWVCSEEYIEPGGFVSSALAAYRRHRLAQRIAARPADKLVSEVNEYLETAFMDSPGVSGGEVAPHAHWCAYLLDRLNACGYSVDWEAVQDWPFTRIFQLIKIGTHRLYPETPLVNPSDRVFVDELKGSK